MELIQNMDNDLIDVKIKQEGIRVEFTVPREQYEKDKNIAV